MADARRLNPNEGETTVTTPNPDDDPEWTTALIEQRIAQMSDEQFDALVRATRPPRLTPKQAAAEKLQQYLDQHRYTVKPKPCK